MLISERAGFQKKILQAVNVENKYYSNNTASRPEVSLASQVPQHYNVLKDDIFHSSYSKDANRRIILLL